MTPTPEAILTEITTDPAALGYAGKTPAEVHALLSTPNRTVRKGAGGPDIFNFLVKTPVYVKLSKAADTPEYGDMRYEIRRFLASAQKLEYLRYENNTDLFTNLTLLENAGILTPMEAQAFLMLGDVEMSRAQELWGDGVSIGLGYLSRLMWPERFEAAEADYEQKRAALTEAENALNLLSQGIEDVS